MLNIETLTAEQALARQWDEQLSSCPFSTYTQTVLCGSFEREPNRKPETYIEAGFGGAKTWLMVSEDSALGAAALRSGPLGMVASALEGSFRRFSWHGGPLYNTEFPDASLLSALLETVDKLARKRGVFMVHRALPPVDLPDKTRELFRQAFIEAGYERETVATVLLELENSRPDDIWNRLHKDVRRTVRKAGQQGVTIEEVRDQASMEDFERIRTETARRGGFRKTKPQYFTRLLEHFPPQYMRFFLARHQGKPVSTQTLAVYNRNYVLCGVSTSDYAIENSIHANDLMQWHMIQTASAENARYLDWAGYFLDCHDPHLSGINRYKLKWGGSVVEYDGFSKVYSPLKRRLIKIARESFFTLSSQLLKASFDGNQ